MLARFGRGVVPEKPDLVLWQVGSNAVVRGHDVVKIAEVIREGVGQLKAIGADVILIDPQFAPRVIEKPDSEQMVALIAATAKRQNIDLFRRFAVMRYWREVRHVAFARSVNMIDRTVVSG
jgi:acyl-CoA thioesterase I